MKLHQLRNFIAVAEMGSLRGAARHLKVAQPAITRSVQELELELGATLFERHSKGVTPTAIGTAFMRRAKSAIGELSRAQDEVDQLRGMTHGSISVALSMVPHLALLPAVLKPFRRKYSSVGLNLIDAVFPTVASGISDGSIDCYIGPLPELMPEGLVVEHLFDNTRVIVGRKGHPLSHATRLAQLDAAEWITTSITAVAEEELGPLFREHGLQSPRLVLQAHSALTLIVSILSTDLLAMLPIQWTEFPLTKGALQTVNVKEVLPAPPIKIIRRTSLPLTPAAEFFCDLIRRAVAHLAPAALPSEDRPLRRSGSRSGGRQR